MTGRRGRPAARRSPESLGSAERLPSGRWRASYRKDGAKFAAPATFDTRADALAWLAAERADRARGVWHDPRRGRATVAEYAQTWLDSRPALSPRTRDTYQRILSNRIVPELPGATRAQGIAMGSVELGELSPTLVRAWYARLYAAARAAAEARVGGAYARPVHPARAWARERGMEVPDTGALPESVLGPWRAAGSPVPDAHAAARRLSPDDSAQHVAAGAYRLLRTVLNAAVADGVIPSNPCKIAGAGAVHPRERTTATPAEVAQLARLVPAAYSAAVTLAAWSGLRYGELFALARRHVDLEAGTVRVERALVNLPGRPVEFGKTKTAKSARTVHLPAFVAAELARHMAEHTGASPDALLFALDDGRPVPNHRLSMLFARARKAIGREDLTWHDLRHTGATLAYRAGASVPEVQARLGHTTMRAALIYAHAADDSDRVLADRLDALYAAEAAGAPLLRAV